MINKLLRKFGYYKKDEYTLYMLKESIKLEADVIEEMEREGDTNLSYIFAKGRKAGYEEALEMMEYYYKHVK